MKTRIFVNEGTAETQTLSTEERLAKIEKHMAELRAEGGGMVHQPGQVDINSPAYRAGFERGYSSVSKATKTGDANGGEPIERIGNGSAQPPVEKIDGSYTHENQQKAVTSKPGVERL